MHLKKEDLEKIVFQVLEDILLIPREKISLNDRLIRDLRMESDDATFDFALGLEKKLGIKVPPKEWSNVYTVADAIDLLKKYMKGDKGIKGTVHFIEIYK